MTDGKRKWGAHGLLLMGNNKLVAAVPKSLEVVGSSLVD